MEDLPIPDVSRIGLPGPVGLFEALLLVTFVLHLLPMNLVLGGSAISAFHLFRGRSHRRERDLALGLAKTLPIAMALTITLGIPPLLFIQALHGQLFYTAAVLTAWPMLAILLCLIVGYYGLYVVALRGAAWERWAPWVALTSALMFFLVGSVFTSIITLMQNPGQYQQAYDTGFQGLYLNISDPTMIPRLLHFFLAALAFTGVFLALLRNSDRQNRNVGLRWFIGATLLQIAIGLWFLDSLPSNVAAAILDKQLFGLPYFWISIGFATATLLLFIFCYFKSDSPMPIIGGGVLLLVTIALMAGLRSAVRMAYLEPVFQTDTHVSSQWGPFALFITTLIIGLVAVGWLVRAYRRSLMPPNR